MDPLKSREKVPFLRSFKEDDQYSDDSDDETCLKSAKKKTKRAWRETAEFAGKVCEMGRSDPRKVVFAAKMGLALAMVSLCIFWRESYYIDNYAIWGILTVIVMFEFSIGATLIKGFNRGLGTFVAGVLAFCFAQLSQLAGRYGEVVIVLSVFLVAFVSSYLKLYPTMKPYEYGFRVFVLTYCILMVAGHRTGQYGEAVLSRLVLIALGAGVCLVINICIFPIWSGDDLHNLLAKNFKGVASSLEGCVNGYLQCVEYERIPSKILTYQAAEDPLYKGYRSVVESTSQEEALVGFAVWEPPHGRYRIRNYPWQNYAKVSGALRHCAFTVMALHGCILSEIQAPAERRQVFGSELQRVGAEGAKLLRLLANKVENMEKIDARKDVLREVHEAAELLQKKIDHKSYLLVKSESWEIKRSSPKAPDEALDRDENEATNDLAATKNDDHGNTTRYQLGFKSLSETVLNVASLANTMARTPSAPFNDESFNGYTYVAESWPFRTMSFKGDEVFHDVETDTYESASALSLATFASLLIEFVARLQNVVASFEELSEKAQFGDPNGDGVRDHVSSHGKRKCFGFLSGLFCCFRLK